MTLDDDDDVKMPVTPMWRWRWLYYLPVFVRLLDGALTVGLVSGKYIKSNLVKNMQTSTPMNLIMDFLVQKMFMVFDLIPLLSPPEYFGWIVRSPLLLAPLSFIVRHVLQTRPFIVALRVAGISPGFWWWRPCSGSPAKCAWSRCFESPDNRNSHFKDAKETNQEGNGNERQDKHVEDEESLAPLGGWVDLVAANPPGDFALMVKTNTNSLSMKAPNWKVPHSGKRGRRGILYWEMFTLKIFCHIEVIFDHK